MIDLHTHSNFSDGADDYITILKKAEEKKLECLSITDHDSCLVYEEIDKINIRDYYTGHFISGVELQANVLGYSIELLGYGIDTKVINEKIKEIYLPFEKINIIEMERLYKKCIENGMIFDENVLQNYDSKVEYYSTEYLHKQMKKHIENKKFVKDNESWESESVFFKRYTSNKESSFYVDESDLLPTAKDVISLIKDAGGLVFIPHIYQYDKNWKKIFDFLMNECQIDGIECYYSSFTKEQTDYLLKYCENNNKYISGGSDYHGSNRPGVSIGIGKGNLNIPKECIKPWLSCIKDLNSI